MSPIKRYVKTQAKARQRRRLKAQERLERDRRQAQRAAEVEWRSGLLCPFPWAPSPPPSPPPGPGAPCRDKLGWVQGMLDGRVAALCRRGMALPPPLIVANSWFGDSKLMRHVATTHQGTFLVEGKSTYVFALPMGGRSRADLQHQREWPWRHSPQVPGVRYARLRATSPTYGAVTLIVLDAPGEEQCYVMCRETAISGPRLRAGVEAAQLD